MRRKDREITDKQSLQEILDSCVVCRLGLVDGTMPYVVPMNYGYQWPADGALTLYFHCAHSGRKLDIISQNDAVCFEVDCEHRLIPGAAACNYSFTYASLIGTGRARIVQSAAEKRRALQLIMERQAGPGEYQFGDKQADSVTVFCVEAEAVTGKRNG